LSQRKKKLEQGSGGIESFWMFKRDNTKEETKKPKPKIDGENPTET
jgi:hypothetical protein